MNSGQGQEFKGSVSRYPGARALGLKITAEGVETEDQWRFLRAAGCHFIQGWYFPKAAAADAIDAIVASGTVPRRDAA